MADYNLGGALELDASDFVDNANEAADASNEFDDAAENTQDTLFEFDAAGAAASGGIAAAGGAMQQTLDSTQKWRESLGRTATSTELTRDETEELAASMSNATFPMGDAVGTMDELARQGVTTKDELREVSTAADMVADATDSSAQSIASSAGPALNAMGEDVSDLNEHMDTFTFIARNTTMDVEGFSKTVRKVGPEIEEMGLSVDDTAAILAALEEKGMDSRTAMREFRQATNEAEGDQDKLMNSLGLSNDELEAQQQALADAEGTTRKHAEAANDSLTTMDRLRARFDDVKLAAGGLLGPIDALAPVMMAAGSAGMFLSTVNVSAVVPSLGAVTGAMGALMTTILPLVAIAGVLAAAWKTDFLGIQGIVDDVVGSVTGDLDDVVGYLERTVPPTLDQLEAGVDSTFGAVESAIQTAVSVAMPPLNNLFGYLSSAHATHVAPLEAEFTATWDVLEARLTSFVGWARPYVDGFLSGVQTAFSLYLGVYQTLWSTFGDEITAVVELAIGTVRRVIDQTLDLISTSITVALAAIRGDWEGAWSAIEGYLGRTWGRIVSQFRASTSTARSVFTGLVDGVKDSAGELVSWFTGTWDVKGAVIGVLEDLKGSAIGVAGEIFDGVVDALSGAGDAIGSTVREGFNAVVPDSIELPEVEVGGQSISTEIAGQEVGGELPSKTVGGGSFDLPQLDTGGYIEEEGRAYLHEGEQVVQSAQVSDRGEVEADAGADAEDVAAAVEAASRDDEIVSLLRRVVELLAALDAGDVSQKEVLRALGVAEDRRSGRDPLGGA
jgi:phage-related protein